MSRRPPSSTLTVTPLPASTVVLSPVGGPQVHAPPRTFMQPSDPLEQPTPRCFYDAGTQFVGMDAKQVSAPRKLLRSEPAASGGATATRIQALKPDSDFWITRCPVILKSQHVVNPGAIRSEERRVGKECVSTYRTCL